MLGASASSGNVVWKQVEVEIRRPMGYKSSAGKQLS